MPTHLLCNSSPLNTCIIPCRSGGWNTLLCSLESVFGVHVLRAKVLLLRMTTKDPCVSDFLSLQNHWFLSIHVIEYLSPLPCTPEKGQSRFLNLEPEKMCLIHFPRCSLGSTFLFLSKWKQFPPSLTPKNHIKLYAIVDFFTCKIWYHEVN